MKGEQAEPGPGPPKRRLPLDSLWRWSVMAAATSRRQRRTGLRGTSRSFDRFSRERARKSTSQVLSVHSGDFIRKDMAAIANVAQLPRRPASFGVIASVFVNASADRSGAGQVAVRKVCAPAVGAAIARTECCVFASVAWPFGSCRFVSDCFRSIGFCDRRPSPEETLR